MDCMLLSLCMLRYPCYLYIFQNDKLVFFSHPLPTVAIPEFPVRLYQHFHLGGNCCVSAFKKITSFFVTAYDWTINHLNQVGTIVYKGNVVTAETYGFLTVLNLVLAIC